MHRVVRVGVAHNPHTERVEIKRGTRFKEFLYKLFLIESFVLAKCKSGQYQEFQSAQRQYAKPIYGKKAGRKTSVTSAITQLFSDVSAWFRQKP